MNSKDILKQFFQALAEGSKGQPVDIGVFFADDAKWHLPQSAAQMGKALYDGKEEVMQLFSGGVAQFYKPETMQFTYHSIIAEGDYVHCHFTLEAITANDKPYQNHYQSLFRLRNGKIAEVWEYFDTAYLFGVFSS